jgi:hypothetical protein
MVIATSDYGTFASQWFQYLSGFWFKRDIPLVVSGSGLLSYFVSDDDEVLGL